MTAGVLGLLLAACQRPQAAATSAARPAAGITVPTAAATTARASASTHKNDQPAGIDWFQGSVTQAFAFAAREQRPVLLFWGAQWCPFCHTLKATVFPRPDFIAKTRLFVPVYLDGDDPGAQRWGERFGVEGYPTLVLLDSQRHEIMRLGAGRDVSEYAQILDLALQKVQPVDALLARAATGQPLTLAQCQRLAYNGWDLDTLEPARYAQRSQALATAAHDCPANALVPRARLLIYAAAFATQTPGSVRTALSAGQGRVLIDEVAKVLKQPQLARACAPALQTLDASFFAAVRQRPASDRLRVRDDYVAAMHAAASDPRYVMADRLGFIDAQVVAMKALNGPPQALSALLSEADHQIDQALASEQNAYVRPGLVNAALNILEDSHQYSKAYGIARQEIARSDAPYYYQADLAQIAEQLGRRQEALTLLEQAYQGSRGPATRFQWGKLYLSGLLRMTPHDDARIEQVGLQVLGELNGTDRIADRARVRLGQLDAELRAWNAAAGGRHRAVLRSLHAGLQGECERLAAGTAERESCDAFLGEKADSGSP
jgi:thioredoxin-related protein